MASYNPLAVTKPRLAAGPTGMESLHQAGSSGLWLMRPMTWRISPGSEMPRLRHHRSHAHGIGGRWRGAVPPVIIAVVGVVALTAFLIGLTFALFAHV